MRPAVPQLPWVVKLGGSVASSPFLEDWLRTLAGGGGRLVVIPGGGPFAEAVRAHCEQGMPTSLFVAEPETPVRQRLTAIGNAFFSMIMTPEAIAGHRILCSPQVATSAMPAVFWEAGPQRVQQAFAELLERRVASGELEIEDFQRAASQFFTLLKGEPHAQAVFGFCCSGRIDNPEEHVASVVEFFLRAYARR